MLLQGYAGTCRALRAKGLVVGFACHIMIRLLHGPALAAMRQPFLGFWYSQPQKRVVKFRCCAASAQSNRLETRFWQLVM